MRRSRRQFVRRHTAETAGQQVLFPPSDPDPQPWRLPPLTRWHGRRGVAAARAALAEAQRRSA